MLFWIVGGVIGLVGLVVVARALWGDRARGRKRCGRCWYSMEGVNGLTCPECGRAAKGERGLLRTRRRWWRAVGGVVVMGTGALVVVMPVVQRTPAIKWLPRPVLVVLVRWTDRDGGPAFEELLSRANQRGGAGVCAGWSAWEVRWLAQHAGEVVGRAAGNPAAKRSDLESLEIALGAGSTLTMKQMELLMAPKQWQTLATLALLGRGGAPAIPGVILACQDPDMADGALEALRSIGVGDDRAVQAIMAMLTGSAHSKPGKVIGALLTVAATPSQQAQAEQALRAAMARGDAAMRHEIVKMLAADGLSFRLSDELAPELEQLIRAGPDRTAELGAAVLMRLPDSVGPVFDRLMRGGAGSHAPAVLRAVCLRKAWPPEMVDAVRWAVEHGTDAPTRRAAVSTAICLGRGDVAFAELLARRAAEDGDATVRSAALWSLHQIASVEVSRRAAVNALGDEHADVRGAAVGVLEQLGAQDAASREALCTARVEPDEKLAARVRMRCEQWVEAERGGE